MSNKNSLKDEQLSFDLKKQNRKIFDIKIITYWIANDINFWLL